MRTELGTTFLSEMDGVSAHLRVLTIPTLPTPYNILVLCVSRLRSSRTVFSQHPRLLRSAKFAIAAELVTHHVERQVREERGLQCMQFPLGLQACELA
jgi:membrane-anchored protein YejM (alkaline phosphatase superfamily)